MRNGTPTQKNYRFASLDPVARLHSLWDQSKLKSTRSSLNGILTLDGLIVIIPSIIFVLHALLFRTWIIDDAGISFSYARSLAEGQGLVSQPGNSPVEGYSNPLWTLILASLFYLGLFDPLTTPKLLSLLMVAVSFVIISRTLTVFSVNRLLTFTVLMLLAINTSFVVWTTSGLENPLYVLLICSLLLWSIRCVVSDSMSSYDGVVSGLLSGGIALTRPEGVIFFGVYPLILLIKATCSRRMPISHYILHFLTYSSSFAMVFGTYLVFRLLYFGDLFPNPYYAKGGPSVQDIFSMMPVFKMVLLMWGVAAQFAPLLLLGLPMTIYLILKRQLRLEHLALAALLASTVLAYLLLPPDWMGEFRFATPFFVLFYVYTIIIVHEFIRYLDLSDSYKTLVRSLILVSFIGGSLFMYAERSTDFAASPTVPFDNVANNYGYRFNDYATRLGLQQASILLPDVGGTLYYSNLRVYDLGGLTDRTIARTLRQDQQSFYQYIFEIARPTFIHTHGHWTQHSKLEDDERFRRDYIPIQEGVDELVQSRFNETRNSGDYIRRDVIDASNLGVLDQLRSEVNP